ncbi:MAG: hypothetical protein JWP25_7076 [Bradyrhizobium sp.]|jgi:hypothetical protein|nr:hypothetical protein [Bradyrhizobium sp.]MEA2869608.1 hypothetical protein [Bradyrhizobium sp.]
MPGNILMLLGVRNILTFVLLLLAGSPAFAQTARYELFPDPDVRQNATNRVASSLLIAST